MILIGIISLSYILIFLLSPKDITDATVVDTEYWRETGNRLLIKTAYEYNNKEDIKSFPTVLGDWKSFDYRYSDDVYKLLNADILLTRGYTNASNIMWIDIINSKTGESFHKQNICLSGAGWNIDKESIATFKIANLPNPFTKFYANRLDISKGNNKQTMIYWFMFKKFGSKDAVTMIRLSAPVNSNQTIDMTYDRTKNFIEGQLFDAMYKKGGDIENITTAEYIMEKYGNKGILAMIMIILIPIGTVIIGIRKKRLKE